MEISKKVLLLIVIIFTTFSECNAVDVCQLFDHIINFEGYSEKYRQFAVKEYFGFCTYKYDPVIKRDVLKEFKFEFIRIYGVDGKLRRRFLIKGDEEVLRGLSKYENDLPESFRNYLIGEILPAEPLFEHLKAGKFNKAVPSLKSPNNECLLKIFEPISYVEPDFKYPVIYFSRAGKDYYLYSNNREMYTGTLSIEAYWLKGYPPKKNTVAVEPGIFVILRQKGGWAPGSPGSYNTQEFFFFIDDRRKGFEGCFKK